MPSLVTVPEITHFIFNHSMFKRSDHIFNFNYWSRQIDYRGCHAFQVAFLKEFQERIVADSYDNYNYDNKVAFVQDLLKQDLVFNAKMRLALCMTLLAISLIALMPLIFDVVSLGCFTMMASIVISVLMTVLFYIFQDKCYQGQELVNLNDFKKRLDEPVPNNDCSRETCSL